jgi:hypothetical protein
LIRDKKATGAAYEDAVTLTHYTRLQPSTNAFNDFVQDAMQ